MARGVNQIDLMVFPIEGNSCCPNRYPAFAFLFHVVHNSVTMMNLTRFVDSPSIEQHSFSGSCLTCINVGYYTNVSDHAKIFRSPCNISKLVIVNFDLFKCELSFLEL